MTKDSKSTPAGSAATQLEFATFHEGYVSRYIQLADAKAGTALVVTAGTLGYLLGDPRFMSALVCRNVPLLFAMAISAGCLLGLSALLSFVVIAPRGARLGRGMVFWGDVARRSEGEFIDEILSAGTEAIARERLAHTHAISRVCSRKYFWLRGALASGGLGLVAALIWRIAS